MPSILIPARYRFPDLVSKIKQRCRANFRRQVVDSFLQIYSVQFLNPDPEGCDQIHGKIGADWVNINIFDRQMDKATCHDIDPSGFARLTGPMDTLEIDHTIMLYPKLFRKNRPYDFFHPKSGIKFDKDGKPAIKDVAIPPLDKPGYYREYLFEEHPAQLARCNKLLSDQFETTCGPVKVTYTCFEHAADSFLTIKLVATQKWNGDGGDKPANVYGKICTSDTLLCGDDWAKSVVFDLKRDECVSVKPNEYIRMHRPMTIVPIGHQLKIEINLFHNTMGSEDDNKEDVVIASGTCLFTAKSAKSTNRGQCEEEDYTSDYEYSSTDDDDNQNQSDGENQLASDGENQSAHGEDDEKQSQGEDQYACDNENQVANEEQAKQEADGDESLLEISEIQTISGGCGEIEVKVYWQVELICDESYGGGG